MSDLLPCPFCGHKPLARLDDYINGFLVADPTFCIACENPACGVWPCAEGKYNTDHQQIVDAWNTRPLPAVQHDLTDPNVVHANMLRGTIAKPTVAQIRHIYGDALPDAAAIREAVLWEALGVAAAEADHLRAEQNNHAHKDDIKGEAMADGAFRVVVALVALIDNPGKEVMPSEAGSARGLDDTAPAGLSAGGGADYDFTAAVARTVEGFDKLSTGKKADFYRTTGLPPAWPEGLIHLTGDTLDLRCATEGCEGRVSTRFESGGIASDYCEPCGRKVATKGGA